MFIIDSHKKPPRLQLANQDFTRMHRLFGKPKPKVEAPTLGDASSSIGGRLKDLDDKIKGLDNELRRFKEQLKKATGSAATQIKKRAMDTLKRKRMYESQRDQLANQQFNVDQTAFAISSVRDAQVTISAMQAATKTLKIEHKKIKIADIDNMQDEMEDMLEDVGEISEILGRSYGMPDGVEEEDLDAELACLEDGWAEEEELSTVDAEPAAAVSSSSSMMAPVSSSGSSYSLPAQPTQSLYAAPPSAPQQQQTTAPATAAAASYI